MKKLLISTFTILLVFTLTNCSKDSNDETPQPEDTTSYDVYLYNPDITGRADKSDYLQSTVRKDGFQFSTFGDIDQVGFLGSVNKAYIFNEEDNTEVIMIFDDMGEPAFIYQVDLVSGEKKDAIIEFERIDQSNFYARFFYYDWKNRLGTLLFETVISGTDGNYTSTPTFEIEDTNFNGTKSTSTTKVNKSFPVKLHRFDKMMSPSYAQANTKSTTDGVNDWMASFDNMKNSTIADWLSTARKAGAALTLTGLGVSSTVIGAPAGAVLVNGGLALIAGSTAIEVVVTDKWSDFLDETTSKIDALSETASDIGGNIVTKLEGYGQSLQEYWENDAITETTVEDLLDEIETKEIIINDEDLNDLPDKDGVLQIGLSWDTNGTDIDLWVTDPNGEKVYYDNETSVSGGYLDRDDTDGYGPENIYWVDNIPDGTYMVQVHYYGGMEITNYEVKVTNGLGYSATYNGTLNAVDQIDNVVTFTKSGSQIFN